MARNKDVTSHSLTVRIYEHWKDLGWSEIPKSDMAGYIWEGEGSHQFLLNKIKTIDRENHSRIRQLKDTEHILSIDNFLSRPSIGITLKNSPSEYWCLKIWPLACSRNKYSPGFVSSVLKTGSAKKSQNWLSGRTGQMI